MSIIVSFKDPQPVVFPTDIMRGAAGYFSEVMEKHFECPPHFFFMSYLTCLGVILSHRIKLKSSLSIQPRLYTLILGESADDRKSTAINQAIKLFEKTFGEKFSYCLGVGSAEGLQRSIRSSEAFEVDEEKENADPIDKRYSMMLALDEFKAFVAKCKIRSSILLECVNTLFELNRYENHTKSSSIVLKDAYLSLLACSTTDTYERIYDSNFIHIGFPNRIFLVVGTAEPKHSVPPPIPVKIYNKMIADLNATNDFIKDNKIYPLTSGAYEIYDHWYLNIRNQRSIHTKRLDGYCTRIMMLLAANLRKPIINDEIVNDAIKLCNWQLEIRKIHDPIDADNMIASLEEKIRRFLRQGDLKDYQLKQKTNANRTGLWMYKRAIGNLRDAGEIGWDKDKKCHFLEKGA